MSTKPAQISGINGQGVQIAVGQPANLALIDPSASRLISGGGASKSSNQPYEGMTLPGSVVHTIFRGEFTVRDGNLVERG
jgi:dihydroorotase